MKTTMPSFLIAAFCFLNVAAKSPEEAKSTARSEKELLVKLREVIEYPYDLEKDFNNDAVNVIVRVNEDNSITPLNAWSRNADLTKHVLNALKSYKIKADPQLTGNKYSVKVTFAYKH